MSNANISKETMTVNKKLKMIGNRLMEVNYIKDQIISMQRTNDPIHHIFANSPFFRFTYQFFTRILFINASLLINKRGISSIISLLNYISSNYQNIQWTNVLLNSEIEKIKQEIQNEFDPIMKDIKDIRDDYIAHIEENPRHDGFFNYENYWLLFERLQKIYNKVNFHFSNTTLMFSPNPIPLEYKALHRFRHIRDFHFEWQRQLIETPETNIIKNIIRGEYDDKHPKD